MNRRTFTRTLGLGALAAGLTVPATAQPTRRNFKIVVVGDGGVGKTCLLIAYTTGAFPGEYIPTVFDTYNANIDADGRPLNVGLWDTAGQDDYDRLRPLSYPGTDLFLVCYDVANRSSFQNVESKWVAELRRFDRRVPFHVVGCKLDLRDEGAATVRTGEAIELAEKIGAAGCHECSAKAQIGVKLMFDSVCRNLLSRPA